MCDMKMTSTADKDKREMEVYCGGSATIKTILLKLKRLSTTVHIATTVERK
jgi:hypothetical protein